MSIFVEYSNSFIFLLIPANSKTWPFQEFLDGYEEREVTFHRIHKFGDQLALMARPAMPLSVSLPLIDEPRSSSPALTAQPFSARTVLNRGYIRLIKQVDTFWTKVGRILRPAKPVLDESVILSSEY